MKDRLFLVDAMAFAFRAHFAFVARPLINKKGMDTSACYGFVSTLLSLLEREQPEHIAVVFDTSAPTFRDALYEKYKGHRPPMPEALRIAIPYIKDLVCAFDIPLLEMEGFEADDIIGTLAQRAEKEDVHAVIVSPDKDFRQLLTPHISILRPTRKDEEFEVVTETKFREEYGLDPIQFIDVLALLGDAADNVPGVPGIGEKTAPTLIQQYHSVENLLQHAAEISAKRVREGLQNNVDLAMLSKQLVTIHTEVPVSVDWASLITTAPHMGEINRLFDELEFGKTLRTRILNYHNRLKGKDFQGNPGDQADLFGGSTPQPASSSLTEILETSFNANAVAYHALDTQPEAMAYLQSLQTVPSLAFDTETTGLDPMQAQLVGCSFATTAQSATWIPTPLPDGSATESVLAALKPILENPSIEKLGQNIKYDLLMMKRLGLEFKGPMFDTMVAHFLLNPDSKHGLDDISLELLQYKKIPTSALIGEGKKQISMRQVPADKIRDYACEDADITFQLAQTLRNKLAEIPVLQELAAEIEFPLIPVLAQMEYNGVKVDVQALKVYSRELAEKILALEQQIYEAAGGQFNIGSPKQLGEILFERMKLPVGKKTATGQYSTDEKVLSELAIEHDLPALILDWRRFSKLKSTYVDALPTYVHPETGRIHSNFSQTIAATGRLASSNPNLQNIPIRSGDGREIRKAFVAEQGFELLSVDYSQIELRIIAHLSGDEGLVEAFTEGYDVHTATAAKIFKVAPESVDRLQRSKAKEVNYGIPYGLSAFGLAQRLRIPRDEANFLLSGYHKSYPKVAQLMADLVEACRKTGYAETIRGRRRYLPDIHSSNRQTRQAAERVAVNMPIQGSQADMIKLAMIRIQNRMEAQACKSRMVLQVHDELLFELEPSERDWMKEMVETEMKNAIPLSVPVEIGMGIGENWLDAH